MAALLVILTALVLDLFASLYGYSGYTMHNGNMNNFPIYIKENSDRISYMIQSGEILQVLEMVYQAGYADGYTTTKRLSYNNASSYLHNKNKR